MLITPNRNVFNADWVERHIIFVRREQTLKGQRLIKIIRSGNVYMWDFVGRVLLLQVIREAASIDERAKADGATVHPGRSSSVIACFLSIVSTLVHAPDRGNIPKKWHAGI